MNTLYIKNTALIQLITLIAWVTPATFLHGAEVDNAGTIVLTGDVKHELNDQLSAASDFYDLLQSKAETTIPNAVVAQAQGVLIVNRWTAQKQPSAAGGYVIGLKRTSDGHFSPPAFYTLRGASLDVKMGKDKSQAIVFLMTNKALNALSGNYSDWSQNVKAITGPNSPKIEGIDSSVDVVVYQSATGIDVDGTLTAIRITYDTDRNEKFYDNMGVTTSIIFAGQVKAPVWSATAFAVNLNRQTMGLNPRPAPITNQTPGLPGVPSTAVIPPGQVPPMPNPPTSPNGPPSPAQQAINNSLP